MIIATYKIGTSVHTKIAILCLRLCKALVSTESYQGVITHFGKEYF